MDDNALPPRGERVMMTLAGGRRVVGWLQSVTEVNGQAKPQWVEERPTGRPPRVEPVAWERLARAITTPPSDTPGRDEIEQRLMICCKTWRWRRDTLPPGFKGGSSWPETMVEWSDLIGRPPELQAVRDLFSPTNADISDAEGAAGAWFSWLGQAARARGETPPAGRMVLEQQVLFLRSYGWPDRPMSWRGIANLKGRTDDYWRRKYRDAIDRLWHHAAAGGRGGAAAAQSQAAGQRVVRRLRAGADRD